MRLRNTLLLATTGLATAAGLAAPEVKRPETAAGPYRIAVERVIQNQNVNLALGAEAKAGAKAVEGNTGAQVFLVIRADDEDAKLGLSQIAVQTLTATLGGKREGVNFYGSQQDSGDAVARLYVHAHQLPIRTDEIGSIEGELRAYERAELVNADFDLRDAKYPLTQVVNGVKFTLASSVVQARTASLQLHMEPPKGVTVTHGGNDRNRGLTLSGEGWTVLASSVGIGQPAAEGGVTLSARFFQVNSAPSRLKVEAILRSGDVKTYPFRLENIPLPTKLIKKP